MWMLTITSAFAAEMPEPEPASPEPEAAPEATPEATPEPEPAPAVPPDGVPEPTPDLAVPQVPRLDDLPMRGMADHEKWDLADRRSVNLSRYALGAGLVSTALGSAGGVVVALGVEYDEDALIGLGALGITLGSVGAISSAPLLFASVQYSNRSLRERGVYVTSTAGVLGWSLLGATTAVVPILAVFAAIEPATAVTIPVWYGGVLACGIVQMQLNERGRTDAGLERGGSLFRQVAVLPTAHGLRIAGTF
ncbi:MAG: hypothetical protein H6738_19495 [Alphaproteobacteria bacterium]|nr:hypothetical protein [Alphaproteobacteria bacterium]